MTTDITQDKTPDDCVPGGEKTLMSWTACTKAEIEQSLNELVHFSFKYTNTNVTGGVRVDSTFNLDLPYVGLSTVGASDAPLDYCSSTPVSRQALALLQGRHRSLYAKIPSEFDDDFVAGLREPTAAAVVQCDIVPHRLRQVIVQNPDGTDIALTPLVSAGFFKVVQDRLQAHYAAADIGTPVAISQRETLRSVRRGYLHCGGSNPFNGGKLYIHLRRPFWFAAPVEHRNIRRALAIHHNGFDLALRVAPIKDLRTWRHRVSHTKAAATKSARASSEFQIEMVSRIVAPLLARAKEASALLDKMRDYLPTYANPSFSNPAAAKPLASPNLDPYMRALLDPDARYAGWKHDVAYQIYLRIIGTTFSEKRKPTTVGLAEHEANRVWVNAIEAML